MHYCNTHNINGVYVVDRILAYSSALQQDAAIRRGDHTPRLSTPGQLQQEVQAAWRAGTHNVIFLTTYIVGSCALHRNQRVVDGIVYEPTAHMVACRLTHLGRGSRGPYVRDYLSPYGATETAYPHRVPSLLRSYIHYTHHYNHYKINHSFMMYQHFTDDYGWCAMASINTECVV